jgi:ATP-dependent Clp protease adapter protein ClpS
MEIIRECEERAKEEITRLIAAMATWQRKNPKQKVPANFLKNNQTYTISAFISEVMKSGFDAKYLSGRKLTNQVAKHGRNIKEPLHPDDVHAVIGFISFQVHMSNFFPFFACSPSLPRVEETSITFKEEGQSKRTLSNYQVDDTYLPLQQTGRKCTKVISFQNG